MGIVSIGLPGLIAGNGFRLASNLSDRKKSTLIMDCVSNTQLTSLLFDVFILNLLITKVKGDLVPESV